MNTKMKMALAAGALALSVVGQANAAIVNGTTYANNMVLSVWNTQNSTSYTANLGVTMQSFLTGAGVTAGGTPKAPALTGTDTAANNFSFTDAALNSFLGTAGGTYVWSVAATALPGIAYGTSGILSTSNSGAALVGTTMAPNVSAAATNMNGVYLADVNNLLATASAGAISITTPVGYTGAAYVGTLNAMGSNFGAATPFTNTAAIGQSQNFFFITPTQNARSQYAGTTNYQFGNAAGTSAWTLGANGALTYAVAAAVAPVPEPGEWLLMLSGLALIGFIATRRKNENGMTFA